MNRKERYRLFVEYFTRNQPFADTELVYTNPYELVVATILHPAARHSTDAHGVNRTSGASLE